MYGGPTYKSDIDPRMPGDRMWGSEGLSGVVGSKPGFLAIDLGNPAFKIAFEITGDAARRGIHIHYFSLTYIPFATLIFP